MCIDAAPGPIREIANGMKDLCKGSFSYCFLLCMLTALAFNITTFCGVTRALTFACSVSSLGRGIRQIPHDSLLRRNRNKIAALVATEENPEHRFILATDDTLVRKFGASSENCYWFDHTSNSTTRGRTYLVLVVVDTHTGYAYPVDVVLLRGKKHHEYEPRIEVLKKRLLVLKEVGLGNIAVVADSWFGDKKFFEWLDENGFWFEIEVRLNRKIVYLDKKSLGTVNEKGKMVYPSVGDVALGLKRNTAFSGRAPKEIAGGVVRLYGSQLRLKLAAVWNNGDKSSTKPFAAYVTNRTETCFSRIWALSRFRWSIECYFRASKQSFGFDAFATHSSDTALRVVVLGMFLYTELELRRFDSGAKATSLQQRAKAHPPLTAYIKAMEQEAKNRTIRKIIMFPTAKARVLRHLNTRQLPERAVLKPRDSTEMELLLARYA
jgi:hypothetical protein